MTIEHFFVSTQLTFKVICPFGVTAAGAAIGASTSGLATAAAAVAIIAGNKLCKVGRSKCKRSVRIYQTLIFIWFLYAKMSKINLHVLLSNSLCNTRYHEG